MLHKLFTVHKFPNKYENFERILFSIFFEYFFDDYTVSVPSMPLYAKIVKINKKYIDGLYKYLALFFRTIEDFINIIGDQLCLTPQEPGIRFKFMQ